MTQKEKTKQKEQEIVGMAQKLCLEKINEEYAALAEKMIRKLGRKREVPFVRGNSEIWATAVVHAIGSINFLSDKAFLPWLSLDDLCGFYNLNKSTVGAKSGQIKKLLKLGPFDEEFATEYLKGNNPFEQLKMSEEGFLYLDDEEDGDDEFYEDDEFEMEMDLLSKAAIFIRPKQPFIDWINKLDPEDPMNSDDFFEGTTYLVSDEDFYIVKKKDVDLLVAENYQEIFENELLDLWTDTDDWPETISFEMFKEWFEYHVSSMVYNLS